MNHRLINLRGSCLWNNGESGSVLVVSMLILVLLTLIGIAATTTSTIDILISGNDKLYKMAFAEADGGAEVGIAVLEKNIQVSGFSSNDLQRLGDIEASNNPNFYLNETPGDPDNARPSDTNRDVYFPKSYGNRPHTNLKISGNPALSTGSAIQMAAGYEGIGKGSAGAGGWLVYDIWSQHVGRRGSEAMVKVRWRHVI